MIIKNVYLGYARRGWRQFFDSSITETIIDFTFVQSISKNGIQRRFKFEKVYHTVPLPFETEEQYLQFALTYL